MLLLSLLFALVGVLAFRSGVRTRRLALSVGGGAAILLAGMLLAAPAFATDKLEMLTCHQLADRAEQEARFGLLVITFVFWWLKGAPLLP